MEHHVDLTGTADEGEVWNCLVQMPVRTPLLGVDLNYADQHSPFQKERQKLNQEYRSHP